MPRHISTLIGHGILQIGFALTFRHLIRGDAGLNEELFELLICNNFRLQTLRFHC